MERGEEAVSEQNEFTPDILTLVDEEGVEREFEIIDAIETDEDRYVALVPYFDTPEELIDSDGELVILKVETGEDGEEFLASIDDDDEYNFIADTFIKRLEEDYDIEQ